MAKWLLSLVLLLVFQAANAEDMKATIAPTFKKAIFNGCIKQSESDHKLADMGIPVTEYCQCSSDHFVDSLTEDDIQTFITDLASRKGGDATSPGDKAIANPELAKKMRSAAGFCLFSNLDVGNADAFKKPLVAKCKEKVLDDNTTKSADGTSRFTPAELDAYCVCAVDKYIQRVSDNRTSFANGEVDFTQEGVKAGLMCIDKLVQ
jgi:hypothetical protein